jgi:hypothetical protein
MCGNGHAPLLQKRAITTVQKYYVQIVMIRVPACCVVVLGTSNRGSCVLLSVSDSLQRYVTTAWDFVYPGPVNFAVCALPFAMVYVNLGNFLLKLYHYVV